MLRVPLRRLELIALLRRPQQSPPTAHRLHLFLHLFLHRLLPPGLQVAVKVSLLQKKNTRQCVPSAGAEVVAPVGTSAVPPLWLEQGHAFRIISELSAGGGGGDAPRWLNFPRFALCPTPPFPSLFHAHDLPFPVSPRFPTPMPKSVGPYQPLHVPWPGVHCRPPNVEMRGLCIVMPLRWRDKAFAETLRSPKWAWDGGWAAGGSPLSTGPMRLWAPGHKAPGSDVLERPNAAGKGGGGTPWTRPPLLPFQCLRLTAKVLLRRLRCQEDLSSKIVGPPSAGTIGGPCQPTPPPPPV